MTEFRNVPRQMHKKAKYIFSLGNPFKRACPSITVVNRITMKRLKQASSQRAIRSFLATWDWWTKSKPSTGSSVTFPISEVTRTWSQLVEKVLDQCPFRFSLCRQRVKVGVFIANTIGSIQQTLYVSHILNTYSLFSIRVQVKFRELGNKLYFIAKDKRTVGGGLTESPSGSDFRLGSFYSKGLRVTIRKTEAYFRLIPASHSWKRQRL